jgi:purine-binding chemotaxis protein CheW
MTSLRNQKIQKMLEPGALTSEQVDRIWALRAEQLAQVEHEEEAGQQMEVVLVSLGGELYGLEIQYVSAVSPRESVTRVPRLPEWVTGVTNFRGQILSVIDLRQYLGLPPGPDTPEGSFVYVETPKMQIIFLVDDVSSVEPIPLCENLTSDGDLRHMPAGFVRAFVEGRSVPGRQPYIAVLNVDALLSDPRFVIHQELG